MSGRVFHAPFLHLHKGFELYAVWERSKNLASAKYPGIITYRSLEELLNDEAIELVIINTPNFTHYETLLPGGADGQAAVYTKHFRHVAIIRKVLLRMAAWMNYLFPFH